MCDPVTIALISAGATAAGTGYGAYQQNQAAKATNRQIEADNRRKQEDYQRRQTEIQNAKATQARVFGEQAAMADAEFEKQRKMAADKAAAFQESVKAPETTAQTGSPATAAENNRAQIFQKISSEMPADYTPKGGGTENRYIRERNAKAASAADEKAGSIVGALDRINAQRDAGVTQGTQFGNMALNLNDAARKAIASDRIFQARQRPGLYRNQALGQGISVAQNTPYFEGTAVFQRPDTTVADLLYGAGNLGVQYGVGKAYAPAASGGK